MTFYLFQTNINNTYAYNPSENKNKLIGKYKKVKELYT